MKTIILKNKNKEIFLVPEWTLEHAGFIENGNKEKVGHTDIKNSSGSVFNSNVNYMELFNQIIDNGENVGNVFQSSSNENVGWSALTVSSDINPTGFILKQEAPQGSKVASTIIAPAYEDVNFGSEDSQTKVFSAIAPITNNVEFLPDDVNTDKEVLEALNAGKLRTFVSIFPGPIIVNGVSIPRVTEMKKGLLFAAHPENKQYVKIDNIDQETFPEIIKRYNQKALQENKPVNHTDLKDGASRVLSFL